MNFQQVSSNLHPSTDTAAPRQNMSNTHAIGYGHGLGQGHGQARFDFQGAHGQAAMYGHQPQVTQCDTLNTPCPQQVGGSVMTHQQT